MSGRCGRNTTLRDLNSTTVIHSPRRCNLLSVPLFQRVCVLWSGWRGEAVWQAWGVMQARSPAPAVLIPRYTFKSTTSAKASHARLLWLPVTLVHACALITMSLLVPLHLLFLPSCRPAPSPEQNARMKRNTSVPISKRTCVISRTPNRGPNSTEVNLVNSSKPNPFDVLLNRLAMLWKNCQENRKTLHTYIPTMLRTILDSNEHRSSLRALGDVAAESASAGVPVLETA